MTAEPRVPAVFRISRVRTVLLVAAVLISSMTPLWWIQYFGETFAGELLPLALRVGLALSIGCAFLGARKWSRGLLLAAHFVGSLALGGLGEWLNFRVLSSSMTEHDVEFSLMGGAWEDGWFYVVLLLVLKVLVGVLLTAPLVPGFLAGTASRAASTRGDIERIRVRAERLLAPSALIALVVFAALTGGASLLGIRREPIASWIPWGLSPSLACVFLAGLTALGLFVRRAGQRRVEQRRAWVASVHANEVEGASLEMDAAHGRPELVLRVADGESYRSERREVERLALEDETDGEVPSASSVHLSPRGVR